MTREDLTGKTFGCWKVIGPADDYKWVCECSCELHTRRDVLASSLKKEGYQGHVATENIIQQSKVLK